MEHKETPEERLNMVAKGSVPVPIVPMTSVCLLALKHLVSLQARVRSSVQAELDLHTADR
jgi:hypothetical protein